MILTYENFVYNEKLSISKAEIEKALKYLQSKISFDKFVKLIKKFKDKVLFLIKKYTNGKDTIYSNKLFATNEGFKDTFFYEMFIEIFKDGAEGIVLGSLSWIVSLGLAFLLYILGVMIYLNFFYTPMDRGVIQDVSFSPAHTALVPVTISTGKITITNIIPVHIPDTWNVTVKEINSDELEKWETTSAQTGNQLNQGDTISWNDAVYNVSKGK